MLRRGDERSGVNKTKGALPLNPHRESVGSTRKWEENLRDLRVARGGGEINGRLPRVHLRPIVGLLNDSVFVNGKRDIRRFSQEEN